MPANRSYRSLRWVALAGLGLFMAACATQETVYTPPAPERIIADNDDFMIVNAQAGDTFESLAATYLKDPYLAPVLEDVNGTKPVAGRLIVLPKKPFNVASVKVNGYQVVPVLCYHQFTNGRPSNRMQVSKSAFEEQMTYLKDNGYRVITLDELSKFLEGKRPIPERAVVITIDDGYQSVYDVAYPVLKRLGLRATLYVYTDFVGGGGLSLSWEQMREMEQSGVIDIQSHSKSHTSMSPNGDEKADQSYFKRVAAEVSVPGGILGREMGRRVSHFAYPYGDTSEQVVSLLKDQDYKTAVTVQRGGNASFSHPLLLRRDMVYSDHTLRNLKKFLTVHVPADLK